MRVGLASLLALFLLTLSAEAQLPTRYQPKTPCQWDLGNMTGLLAPYPNTLLMRDSSAKGFLGLYVAFKNIIDPGKWDQCGRIGLETARYCTLRSALPIPTTSASLPTILGVCVPSVCTGEDLATIPYPELVRVLDLPSLGVVLDNQRVLTAECRSEPEMTGGSKAVFILLGLLASLVAAGTLVEVLLSTRLISSFLLREKYDADKDRVAHLLASEADEGPLSVPDSLYYTDGEDTSILGGAEVNSLASERQMNVNPNKRSVAMLEVLRMKPSALNPSGAFSYSPRHTLLMRMVQFALCWSAISNTHALWHTKSGSMSHRFQFLHGIKTLCALWAIMGNTIFYVTVVGWVNIERVSETETKFFYQLYANSGVYTADVFWMTSALLMTYFTLTWMRTRPVRSESPDLTREYFQFFNVPLYFLRRLIRLWPSLAIAIFFYWQASWLFSTGPFWPWYQDFVTNQCDDSWWSPLFFLSSLYPSFSFELSDPLDGCFSWAWWVSVEVLCFLLTPILIFSFYRNRKAGLIITSVLILGSVLIGFAICFGFNLSVGLGKQSATEHGDYFNLYYSKPYNRAHSYFLGVLLAFLLQMAPLRRVGVSMRLLAYAIVWPILWTLFFITYDLVQRENGWSDVVNVLFASFHHPVFSVCFAVSLYLMCLGYEGPFHLRSFFSHAAWIPFSRLCYGVYLYMPMIAIMATFSRQVSDAFTDELVIGMFFIHVFVSYLASFVSFILVERPLLRSYDFFVDLVIPRH